MTIFGRTKKMTNESERIDELKRKVTQLEDELRIADRAKAAQRKLIDDLEKQVKKWKAYAGMYKRMAEMKDDPEVRDL